MHQVNTKHIDTIVIGGGQAGLSVGYYLRLQGIPFIILDASAKVGDAWRRRWDSLRLFTPPPYSGLPGLPFPHTKQKDAPSKDEMADYLEAYARHFHLPVHSGEKVNSVVRQGDRFFVTTNLDRYEADNIVVAMANYQVPKTPAFAEDLAPSIHQLHSYDYKNPSQLKPGSVLVVGAGNSGGDIALELSRTHRVWMSGRESGVVPYRIETVLARQVFSRILRFVFHHVLTLDTPVGRKARSKMLHGSAPLVRVKPKDLVAAGVQRVGRLVGVSEGRPLLESGVALDVDNVVWCTGFDPSFSWIKLPVFDHHGFPFHERGVVPAVSGLYFVGLHFQYAMSSSTLMGVARDAEYIVNKLASRVRKSPLLSLTPHAADAAPPPRMRVAAR